MRALMRWGFWIRVGHSQKKMLPTHSYFQAKGLLRLCNPPSTLCARLSFSNRKMDAVNFASIKAKGFCGGMIEDLKRRAPHYVSDWTECCSGKVRDLTTVVKSFLIDLPWFTSNVVWCAYFGVFPGSGVNLLHVFHQHCASNYVRSAARGKHERERCVAARSDRGWFEHAR
jgi:hypothetical protein